MEWIGVFQKKFILFLRTELYKRHFYLLTNLLVLVKLDHVKISTYLKVTE